MTALWMPDNCLWLHNLNMITKRLICSLWLERSCCKKQKSPGQEFGLGNRNVWRLKLILNYQKGHSWSFRTSWVSLTIFRRPLFPKSVSCPGLCGNFLQQDNDKAKIMILWGCAANAQPKNWFKSSTSHTWLEISAT